jgi:hypothetical protein
MQVSTQQPGVLVDIHCAGSLEPHAPALTCTIPNAKTMYSDQRDDWLFVNGHSMEVRLRTFFHYKSSVE